VSLICCPLTWRHDAARHLERCFCRRFHDHDFCHRGTNNCINGVGKFRGCVSTFPSEKGRYHRISALASAKDAHRSAERISGPLGSNSVQDRYRTTCRRYHLSSRTIRGTSPWKQQVSAFVCESLEVSIKTISRYTNYTTVWNALDYPAAIFPVTTVNPNLDAKKPRQSFYDDFDKGVYEMCE
jgi:hypothetical protein